MIDIVPQNRLGLVEKHSRLFRTSTSVDDLFQQVGIIAARGFDEELLGGGTLKDPVSFVVLVCKGCEYPQEGMLAGCFEGNRLKKHTSCSISCSG